jgi:phage protein D
MASTLRQPRLLALADGLPIPGAASAHILSTSHATADRFRLTVALTPATAAAWADRDSALIDLLVSLDGVSWSSLIQGNIDQIRLDPIAQRLNLEGRDLSSRLIDTGLAETFANHTSSDIASQFAVGAGLTPNVASTRTPIGAYWQLEHDHIILAAHCRARSQWDLLLQLAAREGFDLWVSGVTLHFQPSNLSATKPVILRPSDFTALTLERSLTLARDISVTVQSWNSKQGKGVTQTATTRRSSSDPPLKYTYLVPNLSAAAAQSIAQTRLVELTRHERVIEADLPGELSLMPRQQIVLQSTNTGFDQSYWIDTITRRLSFQGGFNQSLRARNAVPGLTITEG